MIRLDLMVFRAPRASVELHEVRFVVAKHSTQVEPIADNWCIKELNMIYYCPSIIIGSKVRRQWKLIFSLV